MKLKIVMTLICLFGMLAVVKPAQAGCDPCKCGPGGSYQGDIGEWFRVNCPNRGGGGGGAGGNPPGVPAPNCDHICPTGYICHSSANRLGPVYQCLRPEPGSGRPIGNN